MVGIEALASSGIRLKIASLLSSRPATLSELAELTGISVQGVLKHLHKIDEGGLLKEESMKGARYLRQRKLYSIEKRKVADYSEGDFLLAALGSQTTFIPEETKGAYEELDWFAQDILILRRRAKDLSHRLRRVLEEVTENEARIGGLLAGLRLEPEERQIAYLIFTEDSPERAKAILRDHYGCADPTGAINSVSAKLRGKRS